ncbi:hypothetical protein EHQ75_15950 [Leptospira levettii]|uniref:Uncharacterized protein n=1 Tax=Leptospira perdikensis TaxID=2484948 RepID=A0A4R9JC57_9LEPT|nr:MULTISPECIES: hypothetical protein [Leptospira]TGL35594.1 hypothetical protein EHQ49_17615 [Leptospira perdikensis]TGM35681.1 hypothetical protein EHQ75_15950 [Leptospira levettii]
MEEKEVEKSAKSIIENLVIPRIKHPLMGTFMFSFFINNFDIFYMLTFSPRDDYIGIATFYSALITEPARFWVPVGIAIFVFVVEPMLAYFKLHWELLLKLISERISESQNKISLQYRIDSLIENIKKTNNENSYLVKFIEELLSNVNRTISNDKVNFLFVLGRPGLKKGEFVGLEQNLTISKYDQGAFLDQLKCLGIVYEVIKPGFYLVENPKDWRAYLAERIPLNARNSIGKLVYDLQSHEYKSTNGMGKQELMLAEFNGNDLSLYSHFITEDLSMSTIENIGRKIYEVVASGDYDYKRSLLG